RRLPISSLFPYTTLFRSTCMKTYFIIFCCLFLFSCSDSAKKENREFKNGVVYFNTSNSHFLNEKNGELFDKSRKLHSNKDYKGRSEEHTSELQSRENLVC